MCNKLLLNPKDTVHPMSFQISQKEFSLFWPHSPRFSLQKYVYTYKMVQKLGFLNIRSSGMSSVHRMNNLTKVRSTQGQARVESRSSHSQVKSLE